MILKEEDNYAKHEKKGLFKFLTLAEIIFITLLVSINVTVDIIVSPAIIALTTHIVAGVLIMLPVNFFFIGIVKNLINKFGSLTLYMTLFGILAAPLTFWGGVAGIWKILLGFIIGLLLDSIYMIKISIKKQNLIVSLLAPIIWWIVVFIVWQILGLPVVRGMSSMLSSKTPVYNGWIDLSPYVQLPITELGLPLIEFSILCGILSFPLTIVFLFAAYNISENIKKTAVYEKFNNSNLK